MNRLPRLLAPLFVLLVLPVCVSTARADLVLSFTPNGTAFNFAALPGQLISVPVYVVQTTNAPLTNILSTEGLFSAGVRLDFSTLAGNATVTSAVLNPAFESVQTQPPPGYPVINNASGFASTTGAAVFSPIVPAVTQANGTASVLVATFSFQASSTIGNVTTLSTSKPQPITFPDFVSGATGTNLEIQSFSSIFFPGGNTALPQVHYTSSITVVPEPTLILALGVPVAGLLAWRRRREQFGLEPSDQLPASLPA